MNIRLKFNEDWLSEYKHKENLIPSFIYLEHEGKCYPGDDWVDNPVILLGWWLHSIEDLLLGGDGQGISFMEGPFFVKVVLKGENLLLASEDGEITWIVNKNDFIQELTRVANEASRVFYGIGLKSISENLNEGIKKIKNAMVVSSK